jgi:hypothetical protein
VLAIVRTAARGWATHFEMSNVLPEPIAPELRILFAMLVVALFLSACAGGARSSATTAASGASQTAPRATTTSVAKRPPRRPSSPHRPYRVPASSRRSGPLAYSTASDDAVQSQPAPGSCHAIGMGLYSRPDPACTPGALDPAVTQATIDRTICVEGWTDTVRAPESVTEPEKAASMAAYGDTGPMAGYEYDHFVPLELGGATNDPRNLWPEPGASPNPKDAVEDALRQEVCDGRLSLATAQGEIVTNWVTLAQRRSATAPGRSSPGSVPAQAAECTLTASYSSSYQDYDVYVHSNQPDQTVTVTDADGHSDSWHTDASGYADVYFKSGGDAPGRQITARVGPASCSATL